MTEAGPPLTFVTVVFGAELALLELQARSLASHLSPAAVSEIIVIDNGWRALSHRRRRRLLASYGPLRSRVRVARVTDLVPDLPATTGWRGQQIAKLAVAREVTTDHYVLLDAKNHLIRPVDASVFAGPDGRAHGASHPYTTHPLRPQLDLALSYVGADDEVVRRAYDDFPPTATPFVMDTALTRAMIDDVEAASGVGFAEEFERQGLTEFFLYSAWLLVRGGGIASAYDGVEIPSPIVWPRLRTLSGVQATIDEADESGAAFFAVHRTALARGDHAALGRVAAFWAERGLFPDAAAARRFIAAFRRAYVPQMALKKLTERATGLLGRKVG